MSGFWSRVPSAPVSLLDGNICPVRVSGMWFGSRACGSGPGSGLGHLGLGHVSIKRRAMLASTTPCSFTLLTAYPTPNAARCLRCCNKAQHGACFNQEARHARVHNAMLASLIRLSTRLADKSLRRSTLAPRAFIAYQSPTQRRWPTAARKQQPRGARIKLQPENALRLLGIVFVLGLDASW
jgi:hypothetical protein